MTKNNTLAGLSLIGTFASLTQAILPATRAHHSPTSISSSSSANNNNGRQQPLVATGQTSATSGGGGNVNLPSSSSLTGNHFHQATPNHPHQHRYFGTPIGLLSGRLAHNTSGLVYAVDEQTLFIQGFNFDGLAPDTYFWSSTLSTRPSSQDGFIVPDEKGSTKPLERYLDKDVVLRLPEGKTLREINWLAIWSRQSQQSLAEIYISRQLIIPRPLEIGPLSELAHGLRSGPITIVDAQTFLVPDFHYDGLAPAAYFWMTRGKNGLAANGLRLKDENGSSNILKKYQGETLVISLPDDLTIYDFDFFGVWCRQFQQNFGQVRIPQQAKVPPSPKMLGIKPENKLNCEILYDDLGYEIRWVLDGDDIVMQLVGKIEPGEYMAFGLGKDDSKSDMENADAVVAWVDRQTGQVHAHDYYLGAKSQCVNDPAGSCPDIKLAGGGDSLTLLHGAIVNGYSMVTFKRPQLGVDEQYDQHVYSDGQQSVIWAIGTLNAKQEIGYHRLKTRSNMFIDFARNPQWNCPIPDLNATLYTTTSSTGSSTAKQQQHPPISSAASQIEPQIVSRSELTSSPEVASHEVSETTPEAQAENSNSFQQNTANNNKLQPIRINPEANSPGRLSPKVHSTTATATDHNAKQQQQQQSPIPKLSAINNATEPWFVPPIVCPTDRTLHAQIGPTGAKRGYEGLTGQQSWGVAWYINGLLIPEIVLERGQTYRFVVEGGNDKTSASRRHPLYLTDSPEGGYDFKVDEERLKERIFGGVALRGDGQYVPTAEGRLCEWKQTKSTLQDPDQYPSFAAYQKSLKLECLPGQASVLKFTPDAETPDLIYYQCYTYRQMGWRIRLVNSCQNYMNSLKQSENQHHQQQQFAPTPIRSMINQHNKHQRINLKRDTSAQLKKFQGSPKPLARPKLNGSSKPNSTKKKKSIQRRSSATNYLGAGDQYDAYNRNPFESQADETFRLADFTNHQTFQQQQHQHLINNHNAGVAATNNFQQNQNHQQPSYLQQQSTQHYPSTTFQNPSSNTNNQNNNFNVNQQNSLASALQQAGPMGDLSSLSDDLLIINAAQLLNQKQPLNLTNFDQVLKLAPNDLEILDMNESPNVLGTSTSPVGSPTSLSPSSSMVMSTSGASQPAVMFGSSSPSDIDPFRPSDAAIAALAEQLNQQPQLTAALTSALWPKFNTNLGSTNATTATSGLLNFNFGQSSKQNTNNKTSNGKTPKGLQVYIKRLASIYYPVQQQIASITGSYKNTSANGGSQSTFQANQQQQQMIANAMDQNNHQQPAAQASTSSFSLYNLMPKPKIDLSKSGISKKLNKLRFKGGWRAESSSPSASQQMKPPTPNNEFNYDIFNNQLAQLEKQQQQLQSLESLALATSANWPPSTNSGSSGAGSLNQATFGYLPNFQAAMDQANQFNQQQATLDGQQANQIEDQQAIDSINQQTFPSLFAGLNHQQFNQQPSMKSSPTPNLDAFAANFLSSDGLNRQNPNWGHQILNSQRQPTSSDGGHHQMPMLTSSMATNFSTSPDAPVFSPSKINWSQLKSDQMDDHMRSILNQPHQHQQQHQNQQPSVYVTRLTPNLHIPSPSASSPSASSSDNINNVFGARPTTNSFSHLFNELPNHQATTMQQPTTSNNYWQNGPQNVNSLYPSSAQANQHQYLNGLRDESLFSLNFPGSMQTIGSTNPNFDQTNKNHLSSDFGESLSGSGSGAYLDIRQRPQPTTNNHNSNQQQQHLSATKQHTTVLVEEPFQMMSQTMEQQQQHQHNQQQSADSDHMVAMERDSKQPSERQPPAIVHPITGEQVTTTNTDATSGSGTHNYPKLATSSQNQSNKKATYHHQNSTGSAQHSRRLPQFPRQLSPSSPPPPISSPNHYTSASPNEILEVEQSMRTSELQRVNATTNDDSNQIIIGEREPTTQAPSLISNQRQQQQIRLQHNQDQQARLPTESNVGTVQVLQSNGFSYDFMPQLDQHIGNQQQPQQNRFQNQQQQQYQPIMQQSQLIPTYGAPSKQHQFASNANNNNNNQQQQQPIVHRSKDLEETILRSNLIEPISSTLVPPTQFTASSPTLTTTPSTPLDSFRFDSSPFTPIEIVTTGLQNSFFAQPQPEQITQSIGQSQPAQIGAGLRLRSSDKNLQQVQSMPHQFSNNNRPHEPPNLVASNLASRLMGSHLLHQQQQQTSTSGLRQQPQRQSDVENHDHQSNEWRHVVVNETNPSQQLKLPPPASELIILKPSIQISSSSSSSSSQQNNNQQPTHQTENNINNNNIKQQTYLLKPEYMLTTNNQDQEAEAAAMYNNELNADRLAAHQFDRLSSLSSPPTTSMMVDPLQAANTILTYSKQTTNGSKFVLNQNQNNVTDSNIDSPVAAAMIKYRPETARSSPEVQQVTSSGQQQQLNIVSNESLINNNNKTSMIDPTQNNGTTSNNNLYQQQQQPLSTSTSDSNKLAEMAMIQNASERLAQHRQTILTSKQQILPNFDSTHLLGDLDIRTNPGGESALNTVLRTDNKTDNAILSHVMSLISSNALPNGPHISFAHGPYSRSDYFASPFARYLFRTR